jgi:hypothetical protein
MKKMLLIAAGFMFVNAATAQMGRTEFGIKAGVNIADLKIQNATEGDSRIGFHLGGLAHIHLSRKFALQPELMFSAQGRQQTISGIDYRTNLSYINMPVLVQYMAGSGFRLQTGPQLGLLVDAESGVEDNEANVKDNYKTADISWVFGVSFLTSSNLGIDARYNLGLSNINDVGNAEVKNRVWQIGVFYQFRK